ncbi:DUF1796 family putative cysteine peptidase [Psychrobacillus sp. FSL K6-2836]|uniref:DUF1796 family putative cysteine peptidase n=1 Tax=Psychrobacillus sp. FSL K6-2836 TaxID=2921548 RepID=UPI0030FB45AB
MELTQLKGNYDAIFSLGDLCLTSIQLKKHNLRPYSGVFDWIASPDLAKVNELFENQFLDFFASKNLRVIGYADDNICVSDDGYNLVSNHDFGIEENTLEHLGSYSDVMKKYDRRIKRLLKEMKSAKRILFVRTEGTLQDAAVLQEVLSKIVKRDFSILLINHTHVSGLVERSWPLEKVCSLEFPNKDIWEGNHDLWEAVLSGIHYKPRFMSRFLKILQ